MALHWLTSGQGRVAGLLVVMGLLTWTGEVPAVAGSDPVEVLVCYPDGPVKAERAEPAMSEMLTALEGLGGWPAGTFKSRFLTDIEECRAVVAKERPTYLIPSLGLYLEYRVRNELRPVARPRVDGSTDDVYRVLVATGKAKSVADLQGKTVGGPLLAEPVFLRRVVFREALDPTKDFELRPSPRVLRSLRQVADGQLDAVVVNGQHFKGLASLPFKDALAPVFESAPLPLVGIVGDASRASDAERAKMAKALAALCASEQGAELCKLFGVEAFEPVEEKAYAGVIALWEGGDARAK